MSRKEYIRSKIFMAALQLVPPLIRNELIEDAALNHEFGISLDAVVSFGKAGAEFQRSQLVEAIKQATKSLGTPVELVDKADASWSVVASADPAKLGVTATRDGQILHIGDMALLGEDTDLRRAIFLIDVDRLNLPLDVVEHWRSILEKRPIDPDELGKIVEEFAKTPVSVARAIGDQLNTGGISMDALVPKDIEYYERLVGRAENQATIAEYAAQVVPGHLAGLHIWHPLKGMKQALLMGSHSLLVASMAGLPTTGAEFKEILEWAEASGDAMARGALIEIALQRPELKDDISAALDALIKTYRGEKEEGYDQFELLSSAFFMVYGELAEVGTLSGKPVYWQRLAAFAQAALITRCILSSRINRMELAAWMRGVRSQYYLLRCFIDNRTDPMWLAEFGLAKHLKNEFAGRVWITAIKFSDNAALLGVTDSLVGEGAVSLKSQLEPIMTSFNGPLEGNVRSVRQLGEEEMNKLRQDLIVAAPVVSSFSALISIALLAVVPQEYAVLAAEAISRAQYKLDAPEDSRALAPCLIGLATLAANTRCKELADALFILIRNYRRNFADELDVDEAFRIGVIACASREDFEEWCKTLGSFVTDFSFGKITREEAVSLHPLVTTLCHMVPELWSSAGEGISALEAVGF